MIEWLDIRPDDRVLLLSIPEPDVVSRLSGLVSRGVVVGLGGDEDVVSARRAARELENVMFVAAGVEEIPWQEGFFSRALDMRGGWPSPERAVRELARVLSPGAIACLANPPEGVLLAAGFQKVPSDSPLFRRP